MCKLRLLERIPELRSQVEEVILCIARGDVGLTLLCRRLGPISCPQVNVGSGYLLWKKGWQEGGAWSPRCWYLLSLVFPGGVSEADASTGGVPESPCHHAVSPGAQKQR